MTRGGAQGHEAEGVMEQPAARVEHMLTLRRRWTRRQGHPAASVDRRNLFICAMQIYRRARAA
jgi:hypothetical protein